MNETSIIDVDKNADTISMKVDKVKEVSTSRKRSRTRHLIKHYMIRPFFLVIALIFLVVTVLYNNTPTFDYVKYNILMPATSSPMVVKITDDLPADTDRVYLDIEKSDYTEYEFQVQTYNGKRLVFNQTPYGATALLRSVDFDSNVDISLETFAKGDVNLKLTYVDNKGAEITMKQQLEHFDRAPTLDIVFILLIILCIIALLFSFNIRNLRGAIRLHRPNSHTKTHSHHI